jgi:hypothetical protein
MQTSKLRLVLVRAALAAGLGVAAGLALRTPSAHACSCVPAGWSMSLRDVSSTDSTVDDSSAWPEHAVLSLGGINADSPNDQQLSTVWFDEVAR